MVVSLSTFDGTSAKSWLFSSRFSMNWFENARKCQETRKKVQRVAKQIFKGDYSSAFSFIMHRTILGQDILVLPIFYVKCTRSAMSYVKLTFV